MDQGLVELVQRYNLPWEIDSDRISCRNVDFLVQLADGKYYVNKIFHFSFPGHFSIEQVEELYQNLERNYVVLPALPRILKSVKLTSLSPVAWCLYQNLLLNKFCWDSGIPQAILTQVWMHPGFAIDNQINGYYFVPPTYGRKYRYSQDKQISAAYLDIFKKDLTWFFCSFLFDLVPKVYVKELSYLVLNPVLKDLVRNKLLEVLDLISYNKLLNIKPFVKSLFGWVDIPDSKLLSVLVG